MLTSLKGQNNRSIIEYHRRSEEKRTYDITKPVNFGGGREGNRKICPLTLKIVDNGIWPVSMYSDYWYIDDSTKLHTSRS